MIKEQSPSLTEPNILAEINPSESQDVYLLGGRDLEMIRSEKKLRRAGAIVINHELGWESADVDSYDKDIKQLLETGHTPVAIELRGADQIPGVVDIDHHNEKSGRPASITQVMNRLGIEPSVVDEFVAANDSAYIPGMLDVVEKYRPVLESKYGKAGFERRAKKMIELVRRKDREAQGVTEEMESEAQAAVDAALKTEITKTKEQIDHHGPMVIRINGDRPSSVTDRLYDYWKENGNRQNLVVVCNSDKEEKEVWFFGRGDYAENTRDTFIAKKEELSKSGQRVGNEFHAWGGGKGYGEATLDAQCGVVARNPDEVIDYISNLEAQDSK